MVLYMYVLVSSVVTMILCHVIRDLFYMVMFDNKIRSLTFLIIWLLQSTTNGLQDKSEKSAGISYLFFFIINLEKPFAFIFALNSN